MHSIGHIFDWRSRRCGRSNSDLSNLIDLDVELHMHLIAELDSAHVNRNSTFKPFSSRNYQEPCSKKHIKLKKL